MLRAMREWKENEGEEHSQNFLDSALLLFSSRISAVLVVFSMLKELNFGGSLRLKRIEKKKSTHGFVYAQPQKIALWLRTQLDFGFFVSNCGAELEFGKWENFLLAFIFQLRGGWARSILSSNPKAINLDDMKPQRRAEKKPSKRSLPRHQLSVFESLNAF